MPSAIILGCGESGYGSALLAHKQGFVTFVSDNGPIAPKYRELLEVNGIAFEECGHTIDRILSADLIIKSPGIPDNVPLLVQARQGGIPVISEIEFAARYFAPATKTICITGSNGKTTTTTLIYEIMRDAGKSVALAGNIGTSLALQVVTLNPQPDWYVIELSSFQLDGMFDFRAGIALLLNITPDHLDRYNYQIGLYAASKFRIAQNQRACDTLILNADDPLTRRFDPHTEGATLRPFSLTERQGSGAWFDAATDELCIGGSRIARSQVRMRGPHNTANALAAMIACREAGVEWGSVCTTLGEFSGVEHRLEAVATIDGVSYVNDSKATNVDSAWYALQSMERPTVWIAGGTDKGNDYSTLLEAVREHVKALVCMGVDNSKLIAAFGDVVPAIFDTHSLEDAMAACRSVARSGDTVLLSPACASFDLFKNYEDRGRLFKEAVMEGGTDRQS